MLSFDGRLSTQHFGLSTHVDPDAGGGVGVGVAERGDLELGESGDDDFFEEAHVGVEVEVVGVEVEDGVGDELAGAVEGDVAAAVGFDEFDAAGSEECGRGEEVLGGVGAAADGDDGGMLDEDDDAGMVGVGEDLLVDGELLVPGGLVGEGSEIEEIEIYHQDTK